MEYAVHQMLLKFRLKWFSGIFLVKHDDLIIAFKTRDEHDKTLTKIFDRARERNIKFKKKNHI